MENELSYKVYITKSCEVARKLMESYDGKEFADDNCLEKIRGVSYGPINMLKKFIPEMYHQEGIFCCTVTYSTSNQSYEIIWA